MGQTGSNILTLMVDGTDMIECAGEDLKCDKDQWKCDFKFIGQKCINWEMNRVNAYEKPLPQRVVVPKKEKVKYECCVKFDERTKDLSNAKLFLDDAEYKEHPEYEKPYHSTLDMRTDEFNRQYGVRAPFAEDEDTMLARSHTNFKLPSINFSFFGCCGGNATQEHELR